MVGFFFSFLNLQDLSHILEKNVCMIVYLSVVTYHKKQNKASIIITATVFIFLNLYI